MTNDYGTIFRKASTGKYSMFVKVSMRPIVTPGAQPMKLIAIKEV